MKKMKCPLCETNKVENLKFKSCEMYCCKKCSLQFMDDTKQIKNYNYLDNYHNERNEKSKLSKLRKIQYKLDAKFIQHHITKGKLLDVGCSKGDFTRILEKNKNFKIIGIDPDENAIKKAKEYKSKTEFLNIDLIKYDPSIKFDCIIFRGSFQFLGSELKKTMDKISKITKKGSKIIILSLPNSDSFLYYILGEKWNLFDSKNLKLIGNKNSIQKLCEIYNYKLIEISFPYLETPYANPKEDYEKLGNLIKNDEIKSISFWGNIMQIVLEKNKIN